MDELLKITTCNGDKSHLRFVYDKVSAHLRGLETLGVDASQYGSLLILVIMAKLPQDVRVLLDTENTRMGSKKRFDSAGFNHKHATTVI